MGAAEARSPLTAAARRALALVGVVLLAGCAALAPHFEHPRLYLVGVEIKDATLGEQHFRVRMRVQNPNDRALPVVGIDYTINFIIRWRTEMARGHTIEEAHEITMRTMGRGILFNALTLTAGFAMFYFSAFKGLRNFGLLINLTMIWSFFGSFIVVPALLLTLKPRFLTGRKRQAPPDESTSSSQEVSS